MKPESESPIYEPQPGRYNAGAVHYIFAPSEALSHRLKALGWRSAQTFVQSGQAGRRPIGPVPGHPVVFEWAGSGPPRFPPVYSPPCALTPKQREIWELLSYRSGGLVRFGELEAALWGLDPTGGPENTRKNIHVQISKMRAGLKGSAFTIRCDRGVGYTLECALVEYSANPPTDEMNEVT